MTTTPRGLKAGGRRLWSSVTTDFELDESSAAVLAEACYTVDLLAALRAKLADTPPIIDGNQGPRTHPLLVELRMQRLALAKLIASIGLPKELADDQPGR
ncbi:terminase [Mycobacterium sp. NPDC003323]